MLALLSRAARRVVEDRRWVYFYFQRPLVDVRLRRPLAKLEACVGRRLSALQTPTAIRMAQDLRHRGYSEPFQLLSTEQACVLRKNIELSPLFDPYRPQYGKFTLQNIPTESHIAHVVETERVSGVMELANHPDLLGAAGLLFGCEPVIDYVVAWWSIPGHEQPEEAQSFHRDFDALNFVKVFIHLTDVDDDSGPHIYVRGSHVQNWPSARRRCSDADVIRNFGADRIVRFTGPAGTCFLENTFGFHKGELPKMKRRLMLQFVYSVMPTTLGPKKPSLRENEMPIGYDKVVNRRFVI